MDVKPVKRSNWHSVRRTVFHCYALHQTKLFTSIKQEHRQLILILLKSKALIYTAEFWKSITQCDHIRESFEGQGGVFSIGLWLYFCALRATTSKHAARHSPSTSQQQHSPSALLLLSIYLLASGCTINWYHTTHWTNSWPSFVNWSPLMGCGRPFLLDQPFKPQTALTRMAGISMFTFTSDVPSKHFLDLLYHHREVWGGLSQMNSYG